MSQFDFGNLESPLSGTALINSNLEPWRDALHSTHSGDSRPSYALGGMIWLDTTTTPWLLKIFNGTADDITLGAIDPANEWFHPAGNTIWAGSTAGTANAITLTPTIPWTAYETGKPFECLITTTNTSETVTANVSGLGNKNVKASIGVGKVNIPKGALQSGMIARFVYDGTDLICLNVRPYNKSADIATAGTVNLDAATGDYVRLTGTTTVTAITLAEGQERTCICDGIFTLTDGTGNSPQGIVLPTSANITTAAGDVFVVRGEGGGTVRVVNYMRRNGQALVGAAVIVDRAYAEVTTVANISATIPYDDTIPQVTEGTEVLTVTITPKTTTNRLRIRFVAWCAAVNNKTSFAVFLNGASNAIAAAGDWNTASAAAQPYVIELEIVPGSTSAQTISVRCGTSDASTVYFNGTSAGRRYGGAMKATITIDEINA